MGQLIILHRGRINEKESDRIQQHKAKENPRLSCAHVHQGWPARSEPQAGQRAETAYRLNRAFGRASRIILLAGLLLLFHGALTNEHSAKMNAFGAEGII